MFRILPPLYHQFLNSFNFSPLLFISMRFQESLMFIVSSKLSDQSLIFPFQFFIIGKFTPHLSWYYLPSSILFSHFPGGFTYSSFTYFTLLGWFIVTFTVIIFLKGIPSGYSICDYESHIQNIQRVCLTYRYTLWIFGTCDQISFFKIRFLISPFHHYLAFLIPNSTPTSYTVCEFLLVSILPLLVIIYLPFIDIHSSAILSHVPFPNSPTLTYSLLTL